MTNLNLYKHAVTGVVGSYNESFAKVFGDRLIRVDSEDGSTTAEKKHTTRKAKASDESADSTTDSSEGGNK